MSTETAQQSKEQSKASPKASDSATEASTGRTYTQDEFNKTQSNYQKQIRDLQASLRAEQKKNTELGETVESLTDSVASLQSEVDSKIPEDSKEYRQTLSEREKKLEREKRELTKNKKEWESTLDKTFESESTQQANALSIKFGVDVNELLGLDYSKDKPEERFKEMKAYAVDHFDPTKLQGKVEATEQKPPVITGNQAGSDMGDEGLWKKLADPKYTPSPSESKRAKQIYDKAMQGG